MTESELENIKNKFSCIKELCNGLTLGKIMSNYNWLLKEDVEIEDAVLGENENGLVWYAGDWKSGTWLGGIKN